jgi:OOP family OmpA-OmpF porin
MQAYGDFPSAYVRCHADPARLTEQAAVRNRRNFFITQSRETMKTSMSKRQIGLAVACALALGFAASAARAQNFGPNDQRELWTDTPKAQIWKNGYGECWHSAFGPPPGYNECNPAPLAQYVAPAPAPAPYVAPAPAYVAPAVQPAPVELPRKVDRN